MNSDTCTITVTGGETNAGENYTATATAVGNTNYKLPDSGTTQTFTINPKAVTVSIDSKSSAYGVAIAELTATDDGIVPGDTGVYTLSTSATSSSSVGTYDITGEGKSANYTFTFENGTGAYTITAATRSATVTLDDWTYGETPNEPEVNNNAENGTVTYRYKVKNASDYLSEKPTEAGSYTVEATIAPTDNYQQAVVSADFTIAKKELTVTGLNAIDRDYDGTKNVTLTGGELFGIVDNDDVSADMPTSGTIDPPDAGTRKVTIANITLTGDKASNYTVTLPDVTVTISQAEPNVGEVSYKGGTIYTTTELSDITLSRSPDESSTELTPGTVVLTAGQALTAGTADYGWTFTPDSANYKTVTGTISLTVEADTLSGIAASGTPSKAKYKYGETFQTDGLTVTAIYDSGNTRDVTDEVTFGDLAVGQAEITLSYHGKTCTVSSLTVDKAEARTLSDISVSQKYTVTTQQSKELGRAGMPADAGGLTYTKGGATTTGTVTVTDWNVDNTGKVTFTLSGGTVDNTVTLPIKITSTNYADSDVNVVITLTDKETQADLTINSNTSVTFGVTLTLSSTGGSGAGAVTYEVVSGGTGAATIDGNVLTPTKAGTVQVKAVKAADNDYFQAESVPIAITITKATPTGAPAYTAITSSGKTLADAALAVGGITPAGGSIAWDVAADTAVTANTAYSWTYTPADTANYNNLTGSITPYVVSYSGGGSSSNTTTKTEKKPDGSTTTTVTDKTTGTVTETTKNTDGSTTVVETQKDGTITETNKSTDGTTGTVVTDKNGDVTEVKSSVSSTAAKEAAETGDAVTLPVEVPAAKTTGDAPAVEVTVPKSAEAVKVEIPVEKVTPGTVAVIVHADGTEEIVKTSIPAETGVVLTLDGSATVKIVDNAKVFEDIHSVNHWAKNAVDFVVARGMFAGTSETTFSPNSHMTRAMLMTVLARFDGEDTSGGSVWYEKGMEWATANGVSDGSNPNGNITREQVAVMLWRYAGSPTSSHSLDSYTDADEISGYALEAMRWANENGIINGYGNGLLGGKDNATRTQVAQMLMNFVKSLNQ